jgi:hypothetical protein
VSLPTAAPILQHAAGFDQRRGLFGELGDSVKDTATDARHEARSRDIFPGDLVDRDCRPVMSGLCDPSQRRFHMAELPAPPRESR